eukprot:GHVR01128183.1.p1 GENE.GHVR01128183.1~~GHVR01128183.1.p1  ORF type:complete len:370 (+),score=65.76 GHVR01128183.1:412-1521(+)
MNAEAARKILKKCDKQVSRSAGYSAFPEAGGFLNHFVKERLRPDRVSSLEHLEVLEIPRVQIIYVELHNYIALLQDKEREWRCQGVLPHMILSHTNSFEQFILWDNKYDIKQPISYSQTLALSSSAIAEESGVCVSPRARLMRQDTVNILNDFRCSAKKAVETTSLYRWLGGQALVDFETDPVGEADCAGLYLNNLNTFLYMVNYYIAIPTAYDYFQALHVSGILSGLLLAMAPLASMVGSLLYSLWSNRSFKEPLIFCTIVLIIGNFLYAISLDANSPILLFMSRLVIGFGGNRAANRRYIADYTQVETRTFHSAVFVAVGSLGMTVGPGSQPLLDMIDFKIPILGFTCNKLTSPGWLMLCVCVCVYT